MFPYKEYMETGIQKFVFFFSIEEVNEVAAQPPAEEEEDQNEDQDVPDLTNFTIEELKQYVIQFSDFSQVKGTVTLQQWLLSLVPFILPLLLF